METPFNPLLQQIHIGLGPNGYEPVASSMTANSTTYIREFEQLTANLLRICPGHIWPGESYKSICPRPILINQGHQAHLKRLHEALTKAITDIVQRWWSDTEANFPSRMPLAKEEEDLLLWIEDQVSQGRMRPFSACRGSWRPDFLIKDNSTAIPNAIINDQAGESELFCITEINARFSFNGCLHEALGQEALNDMGMDKLGLASATNSAQVSTTWLTMPFSPFIASCLAPSYEPVPVGFASWFFLAGSDASFWNVRKAYLRDCLQS